MVIEHSILKVKITFAYTNTALGKDKITFVIKSSETKVLEIEYEEKGMESNS